MNANLELDGENISIEQSSPSDKRRTLDQDEFYPADGMINKADAEGRISMVAAVAGQNTGNYFDQDNFYPADGVFQSIGSNIKGFFGKDESAKRKENRQAKKGAKTAEIQSRAELNKGLAQDKPSDVELAKALGSSDTSASKTDETMSKNTKIAIGVGAVLVLGAIVYFVVKKKK